MKVLLVLFLVVFVVTETLQGADARSWPGLKERQLGDTSKNSKGILGGTTSTTSSPAAATTSATGSSTGAKTGSASSSNDGSWDAPTIGETHHTCLDYIHPKCF